MFLHEDYLLFVLQTAINYVSMNGSGWNTLLVYTMLLLCACVCVSVCVSQQYLIEKRLRIVTVQ